MEIDEFDKRIKAAGLRNDTATYNACRLVLIDGMRQKEACQSAKVDPACVCRALKKITKQDICPQCGGFVSS